MPLRATGTESPGWFPADEHDFVCERAANRGAPDNPAWKGQAAAWNAVAYRSRRADELGAELLQLVTLTPNPTPEERYREVSTAFEFTSAAYSANECAAYGIYCLYSLEDPAGFPFSSQNDLRSISLSSLPATVRKVKGNASTEAAQVEACGAQLASVREFRDFFTHRGQPPRMFSVGSAAAPGPLIPNNPKDHPSLWSFGLSLDAGVVGKWQIDLQSATTCMIQVAQCVAARL